jgi:hypothetical protein
VLHWNNASLPTGDAERFGSDDALTALLVSSVLRERQGPAPARDTVLVEVAHNSLDSVVDLLWGLAAPLVALEPDAEARKREATLLAGLAERAISYVEYNPQPPWLGRVRDDEELLASFMHAVKRWTPQGVAEPQPAGAAVETFGVSDAWSRISEAATRVFSMADRLTSDVLVSMTRTALHERVARFLGDIFVYLDKRGDNDHPGVIVTTVVQALDDAPRKATQNDSKLVVVGHSLGGVIAYDILTSFRPDLHVDVFVTAGSQVAVFEELKLYRASDPNVPANPARDRVSRPPNIDRWINVYDEDDVLGFATKRVFAGTDDFAYATGKGVLGAHTAYFSLPSFHKRLKARLRAAAGNASE